MKVVLAPDKFAGTLSAAAAARAMAEGWRGVRPGDDVHLQPVADGGEGTLAVVQAAVPGAEPVPCEVADARGHAVAAHWLRLPDGTALVEAAQACGLSRLDPQQRNPRLATSYGAGQLVAAALTVGARQVVVGLGGSATVDGGAGLATALGHRLLRADGNGVKVGAEYLAALERIDPGPKPAVPVTVASDVDIPLLGERGAVTIFARQKGAGDEDLGVLEAALAKFADVVERDVAGGPWRDRAGAGAAGGLGFGLMAFCGAEVLAGAEVIGQLTGLAAAVAGADVVVTGEGKLDAQTAHGKGPEHVRRLAVEAGARVFAIAGQVTDGAGSGYERALDLGPEGPTRPAELVADRAAALAAALSGEA